MGNVGAGRIRRLSPRDWYRFILVNPPKEQTPKHREILFEVVGVSAMTIKQVSTNRFLKIASLRVLPRFTLSMRANLQLLKSKFDNWICCEVEFE